MILRLIARVIQHLVVDHPAYELLAVPRQLGQHQPVDRPPPTDARVAKRRMRRGPGARLRLQHARQQLQREAHDVARVRVRQRLQQIHLRQRPRARRVAQHPQQPQRVDVQRVHQRQQRQPRRDKLAQRVQLEAPVAQLRPQRRQIQVRQLEQRRLRRQIHAVTPRDRQPLRRRAQQPRQQRHHQRVAHLQISRPTRRLAVRHVLQDALVRRDQTRIRTHQGREITPRPQRQLILRRRKKQPQIMDKGEGYDQTHAVQVALPGARPQRQGRRPRGHA